MLVTRTRPAERPGRYLLMPWDAIRAALLVVRDADDDGSVGDGLTDGRSVPQESPNERPVDDDHARCRGRVGGAEIPTLSD